VGILVEEGVIGRGAGDIVEVSEVAEEDALELRTVPTAIAGLAWLAQNAVAVHQRAVGVAGEVIGVRVAVGMLELRSTALLPA
jgi:hypothetical protein